MRLSAHMRSQGPERSFFFRRVHLRSTCSKVTWIEAINFGHWCELSLKPTDEHCALFETKKVPGSYSASLVGRWNGLRRNAGAQHEIVASSPGCFASARRRRFRNYCVQCNQDTGEFVCSGIFDKVGIASVCITAIRSPNG